PGETCGRPGRPKRPETVPRVRWRQGASARSSGSAPGAPPSGSGIAEDGITEDGITEDSITEGRGSAEEHRRCGGVDVEVDPLHGGADEAGGRRMCGAAACAPFAGRTGPVRRPARPRPGNR